MQDHLSNLDYINSTGRELLAKADKAEKAEKLKTDLSELNRRWTGISSAVDQRIEKLEAATEQLTQFQVSLKLLIV